MDQVFYKSVEDSVWRAGGSLEDYYRRTYNPRYYTLERHELEIDPDEPAESIENYSAARQRSELNKCFNSFPYFCHKYVKVLHPEKGLMPFVLFDYQRQVIRDYENYRFNIISKFRQGGLTTVSLLWGLWRCMFDTDQQVMLISKTDHAATETGGIVDRAVETFPSWMAPPKDGKWNDHLKQFTQTGGALKFHSPEAARGKSITFLIVDEAAHIADMDKHWKAIWPVISTGGSCTLVSTVNGFGNWYHQTYVDAKENRNRWHVIDLDYTSHPWYDSPEWVAEQRAQLGEKGFLQEVMREFLGSGDTYFPTKVIEDLSQQTMNNHPSRKIWPEWVNKVGRVAHIEGEHNKGAMWLWKEPEQGQEYIMGVDCGEGLGENNDNSVFEILNSTTLEQVAEFYSNTIPAHVFAQYVHQVSIYYNNALVVVENNGPGGAVLTHLQHTYGSENLYYDPKGLHSGKAGVKITPSNRTQYLQSLYQRLVDGTVRINSSRFVAEMLTFEYNSASRKAEAQKRQHDDAIMAMSLALLVRDSSHRDMPVGAAQSKSFNSELNALEKIRRELLEGRPENVLASKDADMLDGLPPAGFVRRYDKILKEFMF